MRKVKVLTKEYNKETRKMEVVSETDGLFHCWGNSFMEFESGPANFTVAIVEMQAGSCIMVDVDNIRFCDSTEQRLELVKIYARAGKIVNAVKEYVKLTGASLKDAKEYVDELKGTL